MSDPASLDPNDQRPDAWERFERAVDAALHTKAARRESKPAKGAGRTKDESKA